MNRKGMSQTLSLIVAAMVLMMTALTLIFMTQGSLQDLFQGSEESSCISTINTQCSLAASNEEIQTPGTCDSVSQTKLDSTGHDVDKGGTTTCS